MAKILISKNNIGKKLNIKKVIEGSQVSSLSGLSLWLKADAGVTMGGGNVSNWADQSANANNAIGPSQKRPSYVSNGINGKPAMSFNGSTQLFTINDSSSLDITTGSVYVVMQRVGDGAGNDALLMKNGNTSSSNGAFGLVLFSSATNWVAGINDGNGWQDNYSSFNVSDNNPKIIGFRIDGTKFYAHQNDQTSSNLTGRPITTTNGTLQIGGYDASFNDAEYFNGKISEIIIFNRYLNDDEHLSVTNYLNSKYSIYASSYTQNGKLRIKLPLSVPIDGLFAFWNLNETNGTRYDSSGNGRNLMESFGTVLSTTGKIRNCANFDGQNGGGSTNSKLGSTSFGINPNSDFSMSVWMKPRSFSSYQHIIGAPFQNGFYIAANGPQYGSTVGYNLTFNLFNGTVWGINAPTTDFDTWHHYVFIRDGNALKLYADNIYIGSTSIVGKSFAGASVFSVGGGEYNEYYFNGDIDAIGVWTRVLTESEISRLYNNGNGSEI